MLQYGGSINGGTSSHHPFLDGIFHDNPSSYCGTPIYGNPHIVDISTLYMIFTLMETMKHRELHLEYKLHEL